MLQGDFERVRHIENTEGGDLMGRELHKKGNKYAIYSSVIDDYTTPFLEKDLIRKIWFYDLVMNDIKKVNKLIQNVDCEFYEKE